MKIGVWTFFRVLSAIQQKTPATALRRKKNLTIYAAGFVPLREIILRIKNPSNNFYNPV
jgi:hypothetical protein